MSDKPVPVFTSFGKSTNGELIRWTAPTFVLFNLFFFFFFFFFFLDLADYFLFLISHLQTSSTKVSLLLTNSRLLPKRRMAW